MNPKILALILLVLGIIATFVLSNDKKAPTVPDYVTTPNTPIFNYSLAAETKLCYIRKFQGALPSNIEPDIDYLELQLDAVTKAATGIYNWIPSGKDSGRGNLYGSYEIDTQATTTNQTESLQFKGKYLYMIEGSEEGREMYIKFNANGAQLGKGELSGDGSAELKYKNPDLLTYSDTLTRVDCTTVKPEYTTVPVRGNGGES